jgi:hypothetical protein
MKCMKFKDVTSGIRFVAEDKDRNRAVERS